MTGSLHSEEIVSLQDDTHAIPADGYSHFSRQAIGRTHYLPVTRIRFNHYGVNV